MQALKIKLYQNLCNYRKEGSFGYVQTYPLPTPSMIRGMLHDVLEANEYIPIKISIQGKSDLIITNIQRVYKFDRKRKIYICPICNKKFKDDKKKAKECHKVNENEVLIQEENRQIIEHLSKALDIGIQFIDLHVNINLILHICFESNNEIRCEELYQKIQKKVPVLGRNEDIAMIEDLKILRLQNYSGRTALSKFPMYVIQDALIENVGTKYRLPFWYEKVNSFSDNRIFHFLEVNYISENVQLRDNSIYIDNEGDLVHFLSSR